MSSNKSDFLCFRAVCSNQATASEMDGSADRFLHVLDLLGRQKVSSSHTDRETTKCSSCANYLMDWTDDQWKEEVFLFKSFIALYTRVQNTAGPLT